MDPGGGPDGEPVEAGASAATPRERLLALPRVKAAGEIELEHGLLGAVGIVRWVALVWMLTLTVWEWVQGNSITRPGAVLVLCGLATGFTVWATVARATRPEALLAPAAVIVEVVIAVNLGVADGYAFDGTQSQHFGSAWPLASVLTAGIAFGGLAGLGVGAVVGLAGLGGAIVSTGLNQTAINAGVVSSGVLYALAGGAAGLATTRLRAAERALAVAQAREEVARTLHDGVLQTLAVVQRRSDDGELVALAAEQERDLREYLSGTTTGADLDLVSALRRIAARAERTHGLRVAVTSTGLEPAWADAVVETLAGVVTEALTNAAKHGGSSTATIFLDETDEGALFCSVKDDGAGFDPDDTTDGIGLARSIRGRVDDAGGTVDVVSAPGRGTEVRIVLPPPPVRGGAR